MKKIKSLLFPIAEFIWWGLVTLSTINTYLYFNKILVIYYLLTGIIPYLIGKYLKKDRWFFSYYTQSFLGLMLYHPFVTIFLHNQPITKVSLQTLFPSILGGVAGLSYFLAQRKVKYNKLYAFLIFFVFYILIGINI